MAAHSSSQKKRKQGGKGRPFPKGVQSGKPFPPGVSGNPGGRPKMDPEVKETLLKAIRAGANSILEATTATKTVIIGNKEEAFPREDPDHAIRIRAFAEACDRIHGKAPQEIQTEQNVTVTDETRSLEEQLATIIARHSREDTDP